MIELAIRLAAREGFARIPHTKLRGRRRVKTLNLIRLVIAIPSVERRMFT
jgi:hypothetical protein